MLDEARMEHKGFISFYKFPVTELYGLGSIDEDTVEYLYGIEA